MEISLEPGKYVVAVSGGVDSVVLLDILAKNKKLKLVIAHFDHGIRGDSKQDRKFVQKLATRYNLPFYYEQGKLGRNTSEAKARAARYGFLRKIREFTESKAIVTAHHQDDLIETAFINLLRGTQRQGLSSLRSSSHIKRPLLHITKQEIKNYAREQKLDWHEDSTNAENKYLRNYLRNVVLPKLSKDKRIQLVNILNTAAERNSDIHQLLDGLFCEKNNETIDPSWFILQPHEVAREVLGHWLRTRGVAYDRKTLERLVASLKTLPIGAKADVSGGWYLQIFRDNIRLQRQ